MTEIKVRVPLFALVSAAPARSLVFKAKENNQLFVPLFTSIDYAKDFLAREGLNESIHAMLSFEAVSDFLIGPSVPKQFSVMFDPAELGKWQHFQLEREEVLFQISKSLNR